MLQERHHQLALPDAITEITMLANKVYPHYSNLSFTLLDIRDLDKYKQGHIPGAIHINRSSLEDGDSDIDGIIAPPRQMEETLGSLGITNNTSLVIYDDDYGCRAAYLWWILKVYGHERVQVLNGGLDAWKLAGYEQEREASGPLTIDKEKPPCKYIIQ